jgi:MoxR-like ATPase
LYGFTDGHGRDHRTPLWEAFENGGVFLLDEIDNGNSNLIAALNALISNGFATFGGKTIYKHQDLKILAAANTAGLGPEADFIGRMGVDIATLDRFAKVMVLVDTDLETAIIGEIIGDRAAPVLVAKINALREAVKAKGLRVIVSPRTTIDSARLLKAGFSLEYALRAKALANVDEAQAAGLLAAVR